MEWRAFLIRGEWLRESPSDCVTDSLHREEFFILVKNFFFLFLLLSCVLAIWWPILIYIIFCNYLSVARKHIEDFFSLARCVAVISKVSCGQTSLSSVFVCSSRSKTAAVLTDRSGTRRSFSLRTCARICKSFGLVVFQQYITSLLASVAIP